MAKRKGRKVSSGSGQQGGLIPKTFQDSVLDFGPEFLKKVAALPRLSREEEFELAVKWIEKKDVEAAKKLVLGNLWLVVKIAKEYHRSAQSLLDLVQEGTLGLLEAVRNFDPFKGVRFPTYAVFWIKAYIIKYILDNYRLVRLGTNQAERRLFFGLQRSQSDSNLPATESDRQLAELLGVTIEKVEEVRQRMSSRELSLQETVNEDGLTVEETLPDRSIDIEEDVFKREFAEQLRKSIETFANTLPPRDRQIFYKRVIQENKETLQELSNSLGLSIERVRQIENKIKQSLKNFLLDRFREEIIMSQ